jgi:hypothetical protein
VTGLITEVLGLNVFAEMAYTQRHFAGLEYTARDNQVPARFPRELNVSGFQMAVGIQVRVPRGKPAGAGLRTAAECLTSPSSP